MGDEIAQADTEQYLKKGVEADETALSEGSARDEDVEMGDDYSDAREESDGDESGQSVDGSDAEDAKGNTLPSLKEEDDSAQSPGEADLDKGDVSADKDADDIELDVEKDLASASDKEPSVEAEVEADAAPSNAPNQSGDDATGNENEKEAEAQSKSGSVGADAGDKVTPKIEDESSRGEDIKRASDSNVETDPGSAVEREESVDPARFIYQETSESLHSLVEKPNIAKQTHAVIIPSYSMWFNMKKIHQIEKKSLPEFFTCQHPSKSPKIYMGYRNFMINSYRLNPNEYLTLTSCRRNLVGDASTLMRVHRFLNKWGLINYQVHPNFKPGYAMEKLPTGTPNSLPYTGNFHVTYDTPRGLFPFDTYKLNPNRINPNKLKELVGVDNITSIKGEESQGSKELDHVNDMVNENTGDKGLGAKAGEAQSQDDEPPKKKQKNGTNWTNKDLGKLILGVEKFQNDWYKIANFVGNKSPQECIIKFLQIPIEDDFINIDKNELGLLRYASNFPISPVENPVISNLAFLTQIVDVEVAKAASKRASNVVDSKLLAKVSEIYGEAAESKKDASTEKVSEEKKDEKEGETAVGSENKESNDKEDSKDEKKSDLKEGSSEYTDSNGSQYANGLADNKDIDLQKEFPTAGKPNEAIKDAATNSFGIIGARSHLFANYEERELNRLTTTLVNNQVSKLDLKLSKIDELEKIYERERRNLARQNEEVFVDRLALSKSTTTIHAKLLNAISLLQQNLGELKLPQVEEASKLLEEAQKMLYKPARLFLAPESDSTKDPENPTDNEKEEKPDNGNFTPVGNDNAKPLSLDAPQSFKIWVP